MSVLAEIHAQLNRFHRLKSTENQIKADTAKKPADKVIITCAVALWS